MDHSAFAVSWEAFRATLKGARIVHHQKINIWRVEVTQRVIQSSLDIVRVVVVAPEFRAQEDVRSSHAARFDASSHLLLYVVDPRCVD